MLKKVVCFGEVLWDIFPYEKVAGGAPMNVAIRLQSLGIPSKVISRIGKDELGKDLLSIIKNKNVDTSLIQEDNDLSTGEVLVKLDENGIATYDIVYPVAWDKIELSEDNLKSAAESDAFVFGSLACRNEISRNTLYQLLKVARYKILDVNLRTPFYSISLIEELMKYADIIKLNDDELKEIANSMGSDTSFIEDNIRFIAQLTQAKIICITKGKGGAVLYTDENFYSHAGFTVNVCDTVGAGDSFLAALISKILSGSDYNEALTFSCAVGAIVASSKGANPVITDEEIENFIKIHHHESIS